MADKAVYDAGDEVVVTTHKKKYELIRDVELEDLRYVLSTPAGRRFLWRLLCECRLFSTVSHTEPLEMSRLSGRRDYGLWLLDELAAADNNAFLKLIQESQKEHA